MQECKFQQKKTGQRLNCSNSCELAAFCCCSGNSAATQRSSSDHLGEVGQVVGVECNLEQHNPFLLSLGIFWFCHFLNYKASQVTDFLPVFLDNLATFSKAKD